MLKTRSTMLLVQAGNGDRVSTNAKSSGLLTGVEQRLAKAVAHPIRLKAYTLLAESPASPNEISLKIGEPLPSVAYHVRVLVRLKVIELIETAEVRGATEHFYRATVLPSLTEEEWQLLSREERESFSEVGVQLQIADMARALSEATFDRRIDRFMARMPFCVDEQGWGELFAIFDRTFTQVKEVQARVAQRQANGRSSETFPVTAIINCFERP